MGHPVRSQEGGIYIEALVAIAILAIALVPIIGTYAVTPGAQRQASLHTAATHIARGRLETLHGLSASGWDSLADLSELVTLDGQPYTVITDVDTPREPGLRDVRVTVQWTDSKGLSSRITLGTSIARRP